MNERMKIARNSLEKCNERELETKQEGTEEFAPQTSVAINKRLSVAD